jgi:hypothetical protein
MKCPDIQSSLFTSIKSLKNLYHYGFRIVQFNSGSSYDILKTPYPTSVSPEQNFSAGLEGAAVVVAVHHVPPTVQMNNTRFQFRTPHQLAQTAFPGGNTAESSILKATLQVKFEFA